MASSLDVMMQKEADRLRSALGETPLGDRFNELYAAQQALAWAADPDSFKSPLNMIQQSSSIPERD